MCADADPHAQRARAAIEAVLAGRHGLFEMGYPCHGNGEERCYLMRVSPLVGHRLGAVVLHEDIAERWQLQRQRTGLLIALLDIKLALQAHVIVATTDSAGRFIYVNDKFCETSKWPREQLIGRDHRIINSGHHGKEFIADLWHTIRSGGIWKNEIKNVVRDGSHFWMGTTIVPLLGADGKPCRYTAIQADITQKKLLQERIEAVLNELLAANRELREFVYVVSHDLEATWRGISSLAAWLVENYAAPLGDEGAAQLPLIVNRVQAPVGADRRHPGLLACRQFAGPVHARGAGTAGAQHH